jgi:hypothetical protein
MFGHLPAYSLYGRHVDGLSISNWRTSWQLPDARPAAVFDDVSNLRVARFHAAAAWGQKAAILLNHVSRVWMDAVTIAYQGTVLNGTNPRGRLPDTGHHPLTAF